MWLGEDLSLESVRGFSWSSNQVKGEDLEEIRDAAASAGARAPFLHRREKTSISPVSPLLVSSPIPILGASNLYLLPRRSRVGSRGVIDAL